LFENPNRIVQSVEFWMSLYCGKVIYFDESATILFWFKRFKTIEWWSKDLAGLMSYWFFKTMVQTLSFYVNKECQTHSTLWTLKKNWRSFTNDVAWVRMQLWTCNNIKTFKKNCRSFASCKTRWISLHKLHVEDTSDLS
jgi:hypothetical protein